MGCARDDETKERRGGALAHCLQRRRLHLDGGHLDGGHLDGRQLDGRQLDGGHLDGRHLDVPGLDVPRVRHRLGAMLHGAKRLRLFNRIWLRAVVYSDGADALPLALEAGPRMPLAAGRFACFAMKASIALGAALLPM